MSLDINLEPLSVEDLEGQPVATTETIHVPVVPVPDEALPMSYRHPTLGAPVETWPYTARDGSLVGFIAVWIDDDGNVERRPLTFCRSSGSTGWRAEGFPAPYPLFNASALASNVEAPVVIVNDERQAQAAQVLFPGHIAVCSPYELGLMAKTDWSALQGRDVIVCPAAGELAGQFATLGAECAYRAGADTVRVLMLDTIGQIVRTPGGLSKRPATPEGWGLEQAIRDGWTPEAFAKQVGALDALPLAPKPLAFDSSGNVSFRRTDSGIEVRRIVDNRTMWINICGPLDIVALVRDADGMNWGKKVRFTTPDATTMDMVLPAATLAGDGREYRELLQGAGFVMKATRFARESLQEYLSLAVSATRELTVDRIGWHDGVYVTPRFVEGQHPSGDEITYVGSNQTKVGRKAGSLEGWQADVAAPAAGSATLVLALSAAFAAPLITLVQGESGGFHFVGGSSIGKTTALQVAGSVWGGGGIDGYLRSWRATSNGMEGVAAAHCDALLCLDEFGQVSGKEADQCVYMLANGMPKSRATRSGGNRPFVTWRVMLLSSGELTLEAKIGEVKGAARVAAGLLVRFVDLEADAGKGLGLFEDIGPYGSPEALARALKAGSGTHYGHAGAAFVAHLAADVPKAADTAHGLMDEWLEGLAVLKQADGQVHRVARRFALVAAAGEMAIAAGIVPWGVGVAASAAKPLFNRWLEARGGIAPEEIRLTLEQVRHYLQQNASRLFGGQFGSSDPASAATSGFIKKGANDERLFCFPVETFKLGVCAGLSHKRVGQILKSLDFLDVNDSAKDQHTKNVNYAGKSIRVYAIKESILTVEPETTPFDTRARMKSRLKQIT